MSGLNDPDVPPTFEPSPVPAGPAAGGTDPLTALVAAVGNDRRGSLGPDGTVERNTGLSNPATRHSTGTEVIPQHIPILYGPKDWDAPALQESVDYYRPPRPNPAALTGEEGESQP